MRRPALRIVQALCATAITSLAAFARPAPPPAAQPVWLSIFGERELPDGSWSGADLLAADGSQIDRFQVTIRPESATYVRIEAVTSEGVQQLFPSRPEEALLAADRSWSLPGPRAFFEIRGEAKLRVVLRQAAVAGSGETPVFATPGAHPVTYPLSDGAAFRLGERAFVPAATGSSALTVPLHGR